MTLSFTKMHGLGNDFMVIDGIHQHITLTPKEIAALSDRHRGIGFDQCLWVEKSTDEHIDFFYRIFNANGQEVGQCGNGARCLARFLQHHRLTEKTQITVATHTTQMELCLNEDHSVTITMRPPQLDPIHIPLIAKTQSQRYALTFETEPPCDVHAISVGNPHAVLPVSSMDDALIGQLGALISRHPLFPEETNVGFMQVLTASSIALRVYERGCGETEACGSGAVAAAAIGMLYYGLEDTISVTLPGGILHVHWPQKTGPIFLTGPATLVYDGQLLDM